jgi:hypothetical protein
MNPNRLRPGFVKTTREVTVYREQEGGYAEDEVKMGVDSVFRVADKTESKMLKGKKVEAVLFTIGNNGWFWMPKPEFVQSTKPHDVKMQTGIPLQP